MGKCKKAAFTLAEVLITLGIIGVVAAMTLPTLMTNANIRTVEAKFKQDFATLSQAFKTAESITSVPLSVADGDMNLMKDWYLESLAPHLKTTEVCYNTKGCWHNGYSMTLGGVKAYCANDGVGIGTNIIVAKLPNGTSVSFDIYGKGSIKKYFGVDADEPQAVAIFVDTNGSNGSNVVGKDIYPLVYTSRGVVPAGIDMSIAEIDKNCSTTATGDNGGYFCSSKMIRNGWKIDRLIWTK